MAPAPPTPRPGDPDGGQPSPSGRQPSPSSGALASPAARGPVRRWLAAGLVALLAGALIWSLAGQWRQVGRELGRLPGAALLAAGAFSLAATLAYLPAWRAALAAVGAPIPARQGARVFFVGQLGKYLPGSVWPLLAQMELARGRVSRDRVAIGALLQLALSVLVLSLLGLAAVPLAARLPAAARAAILAAAAGGLVVVWPPVLTRVLAVLLRVLGRPPLGQQVPGGALLRSAGWSALAALALAGQAAALARGMGTGPRDSLLAGAALLLSLAAGILVVPVPAGAGVREGVLVLLLHGRLGLAEATALALLSRLLLTGADGVLAALGAWWGRAGRPGPT